MLTRFLPFMVFSGKRPTPKYVQYLGKALPTAVFGMLVVYCLKNVSILTGSHGIPELIAIAVTVSIHLWKRKCSSPSREEQCAICCWCSSCSEKSYSSPIRRASAKQLTERIGIDTLRFLDTYA